MPVLQTAWICSELKRRFSTMQEATRNSMPPFSRPPTGSPTQSARFAETPELPPITLTSPNIEVPNVKRFSLASAFIALATTSMSTFAGDRITTNLPGRIYAAAPAPDHLTSLPPGPVVVLPTPTTYPPNYDQAGSPALAATPLPASSPSPPNPHPAPPYVEMSPAVYSPAPAPNEPADSGARPNSPIDEPGIARPEPAPGVEQLGLATTIPLPGHSSDASAAVAGGLDSRISKVERAIQAYAGTLSSLQTAVGEHSTRVGDAHPPLVGNVDAVTVQIVDLKTQLTDLKIQVDRIAQMQSQLTAALLADAGQQSRTVSAPQPSPPVASSVAVASSAAVVSLEPTQNTGTGPDSNGKLKGNPNVMNIWIDTGHDPKFGSSIPLWHGIDFGRAKQVEIPPAATVAGAGAIREDAPFAVALAFHDSQSVKAASAVLENNAISHQNFSNRDGMHEIDVGHYATLEEAVLARDDIHRRSGITFKIKDPEGVLHD